MFFKGYFQLVTAGQFVAMGLIAAGAIAGIIAVMGAMVGLLPWLHVNVLFGTTEVAWFGAALQIGVTVLLLALTVFLPSAQRVLELETSHRRFEIDMDDVTRAYRAAHAADRAGAFRMQREFDAVRERFQHLRDDPALAEIDGELLTMAAQMSEQSRGLAEEFADERVARVKASLEQRREDALALRSRIEAAYAETRELRRLLEDVDMEESTAAAQIERLREELAELGVVPEGKDGKRKVRHLKTVGPA